MSKDQALVCLHDEFLSTVTNIETIEKFADRKKTVNGRFDWFTTDFTLLELKELRASLIIFWIIMKFLKCSYECWSIKAWTFSDLNRKGLIEINHTMVSSKYRLCKNTSTVRVNIQAEYENFVIKIKLNN